MNKLQFAFTIIFLFSGVCASSKTIVVDDKISTKTINDKLAALQSGDTLLLKKGYYRVNLKLINKSGIQDTPHRDKGGRPCVYYDRWWST